jgi:hypothetical protein
MKRRQPILTRTNSCFSPGKFFCADGNYYGVRFLTDEEINKFKMPKEKRRKHIIIKEEIIYER